MATLHEQISLLIYDAMKDSPFQIRGLNNLDAYVEKLLCRAELVTWYSTGKLQGLVAFYANDPAGETAFVTMVVVAREKQRQRVAKSLLEAVVKSISARGYQRCRLEVKDDDTGAIALYRSVGFRRVGADKGTVTMELDLPVAKLPPGPAAEN